MKRDFELIRKLLFYFEEKTDDKHVHAYNVKINGYNELEIKYHLLLMYEAGLIICEPEISKAGRTICVVPFSLTWEGHEFLESVRNQGIWKKAKSIFQEKGLDISYGVIKGVLINLVKNELG